MSAILRHRGPDEEGFYESASIGLANARLSIIDLPGGRQPIHNEAGTVHITFNGEIYNFQELRARLEARGHRFYTNSDTEVIVHLYEDEGTNFLVHLNGMFAFALWDERNGRLILARDRMGIKPLYWAEYGGVVYFASEAKAILLAGIPREVDLEGLDLLINLSYIPGSKTLFKGIQKLEPGKYLELKEGRISITSYWEIPPKNPILRAADLIPLLAGALERAVRRQLVADVPVGSFLSGGLDSVTGDARLFYRINGKTFFGTISSMFEEVCPKTVLVDGSRAWIIPENKVEVLTSSDMKQRHANVVWGPVQALYRHSTNKDVYDIRLRGGRRIKVTEDHSVFKVANTHDGLSGHPVKVKSLRSGDRLYVAVDMSAEVERSDLGRDQDLQLLTIAGLYTADGYLSRDGRHITIAAGNDTSVVEFLQEIGRESVPRALSLTDKIAIELQHTEYSREAVVQLTEKYMCSPQTIYTAKSRKLGKKIPVRRHRFATYVSKKGDVSFASSEFVSWLRKNGFEGDSRSKRVPLRLVTADKASIAAFLRGYFSGDGSVYSINRRRLVVNCCSINRRLLEDVQTLLSRVGIYSVISGPNRPGKSSYPRSSKSFILTINRLESLRRFRERIGFIQPRRTRKLSVLIGGRKSYPLTSATIERIRKLPRQERVVYDLQVQGTQRFVANGILCHNTSIIVALAAKYHSGPLKTFCMGFGEETDEFADARLVAERFGTDHHELMVDASSAMKLYPKMIWHMEGPKINLYPWFVCEQVRKYVKVCLSGNGGDELFAGYYSRYRNSLRMNALNHPILKPLARATAAFLKPSGNHSSPRSQNRIRALAAAGDKVRSYSIIAGELSDYDRSELFAEKRSSLANSKPHFQPYFGKDDSMIDGLMRAELRTKLPNDLLSVDDSMSMAHSLELRVPLLDNELLDLMIPVPASLSYRKGTHGKLLLRAAVKDLLPEQTLRKPKWGFSVDIYSWYTKEIREIADSVLPDSDVIKEYFNLTSIRKIQESQPRKDNTRYYSLIWQLLGFHYWHRIFIDQENIEAPKLTLTSLA